MRIGTDTAGHVALFGNVAGALTADFQVSLYNDAPITAIDILL